MRSGRSGAGTVRPVPSRVYTSLPLTGPARVLAGDVLRGAELALERTDGIELVTLDSAGEDRDAQALANAHSAADDPHALAYLGDFYSSQVQAAAPVLSDAGLLQVAPVATYTGLKGRTLVRLMPDDRMLARAIAGWLTDTKIQTLLVVHDHDDGYGIPVGRMCVDAASDRGLDVRARPVWDCDEPMADDVAGAQAVLYVGIAGSGAIRLWHDLHALDPELWLLGTDGVAAPSMASALNTGAAERTRFFGAQRAPWGFYGFEAMALILDAIAAADGDRAATTHAAKTTRDRDSVLGRYSIDERGLTTSPACGRTAVVSGELVWD